MADETARAALARRVIDFTEAVKREGIDGVISYFAADAIYDEFNGVRNVGLAAIRKAFEPQFAGAFGRMRFHTEDMFLDVAAQKALIRWTLTLEEPHRAGAYRGLDILHWQGARQVRPPTAWVAQTRRGRGYVAKPDGDIGFKVDFKGPALDGLPASAPLAADVWTDANAKVTAQSVERSPIIGGARLALRIRRLDVAKPVEMRAVLKSGERVLSETWTYLLPPTK